MPPLEKVSYRGEEHRTCSAYSQAKEDREQEAHPGVKWVFDQEKEAYSNSTEQATGCKDPFPSESI